MTIGFRILKRRRAVSADIAKRFTALPVANVSDSMSRMTAGGAALKPYHAPGTRIAGPALTVKTRPGDNLMVHKAIDMAEPGDVIVVDAGGDLTNSIMGEIMVSIAKKKGIAGFVIYGAIRDAEEIAASGMGMFATGVTHRGPYKDGPGEINVPIAIEGMVIEPGDLIVGDGDGMLAIPYDAAETVLAATEAKQAAEVKELAAIEAGTNDRSWVDKALAAKGCSIES
ncbi:RraA family protein [Acuticoccus mangrovi]|uniref:Putative 4-hydroxy-4-methyl-2-oxoglutarate aldolase n=1 Tax=Acuticoccus mangrovi TaxID=2796142 RepID=A0A934IE52_9HYPH|nr:RraA family protein [Acuticoccus mangrovi]MBJ3774873.1 RraA family protein [Acuticoccus mangrovi]